jgi:hypothetical protein
MKLLRTCKMSFEEREEITCLSRPIFRPYDERLDLKMHYGLLMKVSNENQSKAIK